jgi:hypothetical protein
MLTSQHPCPRPQHPSPQQASPPRQSVVGKQGAVVHAEATQMWPGKHTLPQAPQLSESLPVSVQALPPQQERPAWQGAAGQAALAEQEAQRQTGQWCGTLEAGQAAGQINPMAGHSPMVH